MFKLVVAPTFYHGSARSVYGMLTGVGLNLLPTNCRVMKNGKINKTASGKQEDDDALVDH